MNKSKDEYMNCIEAVNDQLLKNLKSKFKWVASTTEKLNIPPPPQLTDYELPPTKRKRKRRTEIPKEVFVSEDIVVDDMYRNLNPHQGITTTKSGQVIEKPEAEILFYNGNFDLIF
ncbi:hypothetical protein Tco_0113941 [Tanacetum coccineum]